MVKYALGFVFGAWCLQQSTRLPSLETLLGIACLSLASYLTLTQLIHKPFWTFLKPTLYVLLAFALGYSWAYLRASERLNDELPEDWQQKNLTVIGVIADLPEVHERGERFRFDVEQIERGSQTNNAQLSALKIPKHLSLSYYPKSNVDETKLNAEEAKKSYQPMFRAGERWQFTVKLKRPHGAYNPNGFDFEAWALSENIRATGTIRNKSGLKKLSALVWQPKYLIARSRANIGDKINHALVNRPYAAVIRALVIGDDSQIKQEDWTTYLNTGTNHLMSISGLHITMLSGLVYLLTSAAWRRVPSFATRFPTQKAASLAAMITALLYAALAGFSIPTQRTLYMLIVITVMLMLGMRIAFSRILAIALCVVVLIDPWAVIAPGFWLSFGAVAVIAYAMSARLSRPHWLMEAAKTQWAVTLGLLPALVFMFGQFSIISPLANAFAIPVISFFVVPISIAGSLFSMDALLQLGHAILHACMLGLHALSHLPIATWQQQAPPVWTIIIAFIGIAWLMLPAGIPLRVLGLLGLVPMLFVKSEPPKMGDYQVTVLDVGQGLSVLVQTAQHTLLYDTGSRYSAESDAGSRIIVPFLRAQGVKQLTAMVLSHDDIDHTGGAPSVLAQIPSNRLLHTLSAQASLFAMPQIQRNLPLSQSFCKAGEFWQWDGVKFEVLSPNHAQLLDATIKDNDKSCVIKVSSPAGAVLLTGDIEKHAEIHLLETYESDDKLKSDVMIIPHHGSKTSSSQAFLQAVNPQYAVSTNGYLNRFGHPKKSITERYLQLGSKLYRSDYHGAILISLKKNQPISLLSWRQSQPRYWHDTYVGDEN